MLTKLAKLSSWYILRILRVALEKVQKNACLHKGNQFFCLKKSKKVILIFFLDFFLDFFLHFSGFSSPFLQIRIYVFCICLDGHSFIQQHKTSFCQTLYISVVFWVSPQVELLQYSGGLCLSKVFLAIFNKALFQKALASLMKYLIDNHYSSTDCDEHYYVFFQH